MHQLILTRKRPGDEKLRFVRSCSAALPPDLMRRMEEYFAAPVLEAYGMTEASHQMASNPLPPGRAQGRLGGAGDRRAHQHSRRARRWNCRAAKAGEVCIDGPGVIREYENNPEATAKSFFGEWFRTGDQGILDEDGYLHLTGRLKELIIRGRREHRATGNRRGAADASRGRRGGLLRRAASHLGRGGGSGRGAAAGNAGGGGRI